jgi:ribosomal protein S18 acetylase RimI-like enzyme
MLVRSEEQMNDYPGRSDLQEILSLNSVQNNTRLWFNHVEKIIAFAIVDQYCNLLFEVSPSANAVFIEPEIIAWGIDCVKRNNTAAGICYALDASCREDDQVRVACLERFGFTREDMTSLELILWLNNAIPQLDVPKGFMIRPMQSDRDLLALINLHHAAFENSKMSVQERIAIMNMPEYRPELDLLAENQDGRLAAYCMGSIGDDVTPQFGCKVGFINTVATHPDFQCLGLAKALILNLLREFQVFGLKVAMLGTSSENIPMQHIAKNLGFQLLSSKLWFTLAI